MSVEAKMELAQEYDIMDVISETEQRPEPGSIYEKILKLQHQDSIMAKNL